MTTIKSRRVNPVAQGKGAFNELSAAGSMLHKQRISPCRENLDNAHQNADKPAARRGQLIDILV